MPNFQFRPLPIKIKAPLMVAGLMVIVGSVLSSEVLVRLKETQENHLRELSGAYLDGVSSAILPYVLREDVWEVFDALDRARSRYQGLNALTTVVVNAERNVIAASDPKRFPTSAPLASGSFPQSGIRNSFEINIDRKRAYTIRILTAQGQLIGAIYTEFDVSQLLHERAAVLWQLIATNAALTFALAGVGYLVIRRIVHPIQTLDDYFMRAQDAPIQTIPETDLGPSDSEFGRLFRRYNAMANAANEREALIQRLAEEEKLASIGRLASGMAHEINNPLGGMFNALDALKRYPDRETVRVTSLRLLETGLRGIQHVVRGTLITYRDEKQNRHLSHSDIEDLRFLIHSEIDRKKLVLDWENRLSMPFATQANAVRQATLNLLLNACAAAPRESVVRLKANISDGAFSVLVGNEGAHLEPEYKLYIETGRDPLAALSKGKGLGLWMVRKLVDETGGTISVNYPPAGGTEIRLTLPSETGAMRHAC